MQAYGSSEQDCRVILGCQDEVVHKELTSSCNCNAFIVISLPLDSCMLLFIEVYKGVVRNTRSCRQCTYENPWFSMAVIIKSHLSS